MVACGTDRGEGGAIAGHRQVDAVEAVGQVRANKGVARRRHVEASAHPATGGEDGVALPEQAAGLRRAQGRGRILQGDRDGATADLGDTCSRDAVAAAGRYFDGVGGARREGDVPRHVERADGIARRHRTALSDTETADTAGAAEGAARIDVGEGGDRAVHRQEAAVDLGGAGIGAVSGELQGALAGFRQTAGIGPGEESLIAGDPPAVFGLIIRRRCGRKTTGPAARDLNLLPSSMLGGVLDEALAQSCIGDVVRPGVGNAGAEIGVEATQELARAVHRPPEIDLAPTEGLVRHVRWAAAEVGRGRE